VFGIPDRPLFPPGSRRFVCPGTKDKPYNEGTWMTEVTRFLFGIRRGKKSKAAIAVAESITHSNG